jgi:acetyltransferase-like isoleucine patch superfamily enzyme
VIERLLHNLRRGVSVHPRASIGRFVVIGAVPERDRRAGTLPKRRTVIEREALVHNHVVIGAGSTIGRGAVVDDHCRLGYDCTVGAGARIMYGAFVCDRVNIGAAARIAGFVCDGAVVEDGATSMGLLLHEYAHPSADWWGPDEAAPRIGAGAVVGMGAVVVGGVCVGVGSYVAAGAVVTKDVEAQMVVVGFNTAIPRSDWPGRRLGSIPNDAG